MVYYDFVTNLNDLSINLYIHEFKEILDSYAKNIIIETLPQGNSKFSFSLDNEKFITKMDSLIHTISYQFVQLQLIYDSYEEITPESVSSALDLTKNFTKRILNVDVHDVITSRFKTNTNERIIHLFIPVDEQGRKIYVNTNVLVKFQYEGNLNSWYKYNFGSSDPLSIYSWQVYMKDRMKVEPTDEILFYKHWTLVKLKNSQKRLTNFKTLLDGLNRSLRSEGYFAFVVENYHVGKKELLKEIAEMWKIELVRDYEDENILVFKTSEEFFDSTKEYWLQKSFEKILENKFPVINIKGPWMFERQYSGELKVVTEFSKNSTHRLESVKALVNYLAVRAYDRTANSFASYLYNNLHLKVRDDLSLDVGLCCYQNLLDFKRNMFEIYSVKDNLSVVHVNNLEECIILTTYLMKKTYEYFPLGFFEDGKYFVVFDKTETLKSFNLESEKEKLLRELQKYFKSKNESLEYYLDIIEIKENIIYPEDSYKYLEKYALKEEIRRKTEGNYKKLNIIGLSNFGPIDGLTDNRYISKFYIPPSEGFMVFVRKYLTNNKLEDLIEEKVVGHIYSFNIFVERNGFSYPILEISIDKNMNVTEIEKMLLQTWSCGYFLSNWCTGYTYITNKLSVFTVEHDHLINSASDSLEDGKIMIEKLKLVLETNESCRNEEIGNSRKELRNRELNILTLKRLE
jgi:hypothetical protein